MSTKSLIPNNIANLSLTYLRSLNATDQEITNLKNLVEGQLANIVTKHKGTLAERFKDYPIIKFKRCTSKSKNCSLCRGTNYCGRSFANDNPICAAATQAIFSKFPNMYEKGVNAGLLWHTITRDPLNTNKINWQVVNSWKYNAASIISRNFTKEQKALVRKHFKKHFTGITFQ